jgi:predicted Zn-ribbon and HTH transcriptional regulator
MTAGASQDRIPFMDERVIKLPTLKCLRCGHTWHPYREKMPLRCARCRTPYWNKPKRKS